jgi:hypothetical protein
VSTLLYPRLPRAAVIELRHHHSAHSVEDLSRLWSVEHEQQLFTQTAGERVHRERLSGLRELILEVATECGFPEKRRQKAIADFDARCAKTLYEQSGIPMVEAFRPDVWSFISLVLLPDISIWRYPGLPLDRVNGGVRDVFRRLWQRAFYIAEVPGFPKDWQLIDTLSEDAFVQILERPGLAADRRLSRVIAETWAEVASTIGAQKMEDLHRRAVRNLRAVFPVICFDVLEEEQLRNLVLKEYQLGIQVQDVV